MAADPYPPHHPLSDLEATTAISPVTPEVMDHAAKHAAELLAEAATSTPGSKAKGGRKRAMASQPGAPDPSPITEAEPNAAAQHEWQPSEPEDASAHPAAEPVIGFTEPQPLVPAIPDRAARSSDTLDRLHAAAAEALHSNIDETFGFWRSMIGASSVAEAALLNAEHIRKQMDIFGAQSRKMASLAQLLAIESLSKFTRLA